MPDDGDRIGEQWLGEKKFKGTLKRLIIDTLCGRSVRKIAIATVHITKRRRLNDDQFLSLFAQDQASVTSFLT